MQRCAVEGCRERILAIQKGGEIFEQGGEFFVVEQARVDE
jgi:hypothetical protein